jgi:hypothetical protein
MQELDTIIKALRRLVQFALSLAILMIVVLLLRFDMIGWPSDKSDEIMPTISLVDEVLPGEIGTLDAESGLIIDHGLMIVKSTCGACHSTKLVAQNKFSRDGWIEVIRWMQAKQNLWDLGENEVAILDYLEKNCAPQKSGRRRNLAQIEWYELND